MSEFLTNSYYYSALGEFLIDYRESRIFQIGDLIFHSSI